MVILDCRLLDTAETAEREQMNTDNLINDLEDIIARLISKVYTAGRNGEPCPPFIVPIDEVAAHAPAVVPFLESYNALVNSTYRKSLEGDRKV